MDSDLRHELTLLVLSRYPLVVVESVDESRVERLAQQVARDLGMPLMRWTSASGLTRPGSGGFDDSRDPDKALARLEGMTGEILVLVHDLQPYLERPEIVRRLRELCNRFSSSRATLLLSGVHVRVPAELQAHAARLEIALPGRKELERLVRETARELRAQRRIEVDLQQHDIEALAAGLRGLQLAEAKRVLYRVALRDGRLSAEDLAEVREGKKQRLGESGQLEWVDTPDEGLAAVGGLDGFKRWVERRREAFGDSAARFGLDPPRGVLLVGVPGTGKSLACRALAGEWQLPLLRLDAGRLYDKYVGETEANLRRALSACEALAPAVLWMDELEKALASGSGAADDGLSQRVLGTLLTWMQERPEPVCVTATSNDVERLPVELLRRGRFDEVFFVDLPDPQQRGAIFALHLAQRDRDPEQFDLERLAAAAEGFSGAEIEGVVVAALYHAFSERAALSDDLLLAEVASTRPLSVLRAPEIAALRAWGERHAVPA